MGFKSKYSKRELLNAIFYINKTGYQWRYLPSDYPPWQSVHRYFTKLTNEGVFEKINDFLRERVREKAGRKKTPSLVCIDSQSVKGDVNLEEKGIDGNKKVKGRKRHIVVDVLVSLSSVRLQQQMFLIFILEKILFQILKVYQG